MTPEQLNQLKELSESFQSGKADVKTIRELSKIIEKIQADRNSELNYQQEIIESNH